VETRVFTVGPRGGAELAEARAPSLDKHRSIFVPQPNLAFSQLFFPLKGIIAVYDRETRQFSALPGADDPAYVQSNPTWSSDSFTSPASGAAEARDLAPAALFLSGATGPSQSPRLQPVHRLIGGANGERRIIGPAGRPVS
jgi:hypothetical protein